MSGDWLDGACTSVALCWRIERRDGIAIGLTAHDRDLAIEGLTYRAAPGMTPSAILRSADLDADTMEMTGALDHRAITAPDLLSGRWDGARVAVFAVDWTTPGERVALGSGHIGAVEMQGEGFGAELRGAAAMFDAPVAEETSPTCRARLGDRRCRVPMAARQRTARVIAVDDAAADGVVLTLDSHEGARDAWGGGTLRWLGTANCGLTEAVARSEGNRVWLERPPRFAAAGALVELREGCDATLATCAARFGNAANFRGEPYLPGIDLLTRYPGE